MALRDWVVGVATGATPATLAVDSRRNVAPVANVATDAEIATARGVATVATVATPEQANELRELVAVVAEDWPTDEQAEALAAALADPAGALTCFREIYTQRNAGARSRA